MGYAAAMKRVCVFCGSSPGRESRYLDAADRLGHEIVRRGLELVYGGSHVGLMGRIADAVLAAGGQATGVIPQSMVDREIAHTGLSDLCIVKTMHERKALMEQLSDAFVAMPGGMGTLEEVCEIFTWGQLGLHTKPCGLLNVAGYYAPFLQLLDGAVEAGFLRPAHREMVLVDENPASLLDQFEAYRAPTVTKWLTRETT
jgi:uncharacterized protein (TIGR00730 family)